MSEVTHTPGPWLIIHACRVNGYEIAASNTAPHAHVQSTWATIAPGGVGEANARLIAAAPDLLAACKSWVDFFDRLDRDAEPGDRLAEARRQYHANRVDATRAAIAKSEGK